MVIARGEGGHKMSDGKVIQLKDGISKVEKQVKEIDRGPAFSDYIQDAKDFCKEEFPEKKYYLGHIIGEQQIILLPGWRGAGKTWFALSLADHITKGIPFGPWSIGESVPVLYVDAELPPGDLQQRIKYLNANQERKSPLYIYNDCLMNSKGVNRASLLDPIWQKDLKETAIDLGVKVIFFDNISSLSPGIDENAKVAWDPVNQYLLSLRFAGITSVMLHHTGKGGGQRGTSGREDNTDMTIDLKQPSGYSPEMGCEFIISFSKSRVPAKYLPELKEINFKLTERETGLYEWGWLYAKTATREKIIELLREDVPNKEIATECGVTPAYVSRIKKDAKLEGILR